MKVLLHGAINKENFGDFLYAYIIFSELQKKYDVYFWENSLFGLSGFFKKYLNYSKQTPNIQNIDALIYIPGGYLCEKNRNPKRLITRYLRYYYIGYVFRKLNKKIAFIGVGGSPVCNNFLRKKISVLLDYSTVVTVRDKKTKEYWDSVSSRSGSNIVDASDVILNLDVFHLPFFNIKSNKDYGLKTILLHLSGDEEGEYYFKKNVVPAINSFIGNRLDYKVIITYDNTPSNKKTYEDFLKMVKCNNKTFFNYDNPWKLIELIKTSDVVITPKLHLGVISAMFNKSVISLPIDYNKTSRFYEQIGEPGRCIKLDDANCEIILNMLKKYHSKRVTIPNEMKKNAKKNIEIMMGFLEKVEADEK